MGSPLKCSVVSDLTKKSVSMESIVFARVYAQKGFAWIERPFTIIAVCLLCSTVLATRWQHNLQEIEFSFNVFCNLNLPHNQKMTKAVLLLINKEKKLFLGFKPPHCSVTEEEAYSNGLGLR